MRATAFVNPDIKLEDSPWPDVDAAMEQESQYWIQQWLESYIPVYVEQYEQ